MASADYNHVWKRFWCPRSKVIALLDDGYLPDPEAQYSQTINPHIFSFEELSEIHCLALLGEPGMGKSREMQRLFQYMSGEAASLSNRARRVDLRAYGSDLSLRQSLFQHHNFVDWQEGNHILHLFLDSLDEARLRIGVVTSVILEGLREMPLERLRLRIACRTAEWPSRFENELHQLWTDRFERLKEQPNLTAQTEGSTETSSIPPSTTFQQITQVETKEKYNHIEAVVLAPLRRVDVITAAKDYGVDPYPFLSAVSRSQAIPLAVNPTTLRFLLAAYQANGELPRSRTELFERGLRYLLGETQRDARDSAVAERYTVDQKLAIASRVAAITVFSNRYTIDTSDMATHDVQDKVNLRQICHGSIDGLDMNGYVVRTVLETPLFVSHDQYHSAWAHQTYTEFLAARYLFVRNVALSQVLDLIALSRENGGKLIPQLHETAAWLATFRKDVFDEILARDPEILLRSDVISARDEARAQLVEKLLRKFELEELLDTKIEIRRGYGTLHHPGLANQLRPYIADRSKGWLVRRVAIDIAEACELRELLDVLVDVALDAGDFYPTRVNASYAIMRIGDAAARVALRPLVFGEAGDDPDDELRGCALTAMWPDHLTASEVFSVIDRPRNGALIGQYHMFLSRNLVEHLEVADLPVALQWFVQQPKEHVIRILSDVVSDILRRAWVHLEAPNVTEGFAAAALTRLRRHESIVYDKRLSYRFFDSAENNFAAEMLRDTRRRRMVLDAILQICSSTDAHVIAFSRPRLYEQDDILWLLERSETTNDPAQLVVLRNIIPRVFSLTDENSANAVFELWQQKPSTFDFLDVFFEAVEFDSSEAEQERNRYYKHLEDLEQEEKEQQNRIVYDPTDILERLLGQFEQGDISAWWQLNLTMTLEPESQFYGDESESDLTKLPGWTVATEAIQERLIAAAYQYILEADPQPDQWFGTNILYRPAYAGYRALYLLYRNNPALLADIPGEAWRRWVPIIVAYPVTHGDRREEPHLAIMQRAYEEARDFVIDYLLREIDHENRDGEYIWVVEKVAKCLDGQMTAALLAKIAEPQMKPRSIRFLLRFLLEHHVPGAQAFAESAIASAASDDEVVRMRVIQVCLALVESVPETSWELIWPVITQHEELGLTILKSISYRADSDDLDLSHRLTIEQIADLIIWLGNRESPGTTQNKSNDVMHAVTPEEQLQFWRDSLLRALQRRGSPDAVSSLQRILTALPHMPHIKWILIEGQAEERRRSWVAPKPHEVLELITSHERRFVRDGRELLAVITESLKRLEFKLHQETPAVIDLWNETGVRKKSYTPKDENRFSDYVMRHLANDIGKRGVVVGRELEFRRSTGGQPGERIDITVQALVPNDGSEDANTITAIIEVKGSWHRELFGAMKTQLVDRYLYQSTITHGLYLVGWFFCTQWDGQDNRQKHHTRTTMDEARALLVQQANELSQGEHFVQVLVIDAALR